jgi:hypothetical protein
MWACQRRALERELREGKAMSNNPSNETTVISHASRIKPPYVLLLTIFCLNDQPPQVLYISEVVAVEETNHFLSVVKTDKRAVYFPFNRIAEFTLYEAKHAPTVNQIIANNFTGQAENTPVDERSN